MIEIRICLRFAIIGIFTILRISITTGIKELEKDGEIYLLDDSNFDEFLKDHPISLIDFHSSNCKICQQMRPAFAAAAKGKDLSFSI